MADVDGSLRDLVWVAFTRAEWKRLAAAAVGSGFWIGEELRGRFVAAAHAAGEPTGIDPAVDKKE